MDGSDLEKVQRQIAATYDAIIKQREIIQKLRHRASRRKLVEAEQQMTTLYDTLVDLREQRKITLHLLRRPKARTHAPQDRGGKRSARSASAGD